MSTFSCWLSSSALHSLAKDDAVSMLSLVARNGALDNLEGGALSSDFPPYVNYQGYCEEYGTPGAYGGYCWCGQISTIQDCWAKGGEFNSMAAVEYSGPGDCLVYANEKEAPEGCPGGCSAEVGQTDVTSYSGTGYGGAACLLPRDLSTSTSASASTSTVSDSTEQCTSLWEYKGEVKDGKDGTQVEVPTSESNLGQLWDVSSISTLDGWKDVVSVHYVQTNGTTCKTFCESLSLRCDIASDDAHWQVETLNNWITGTMSFSTTYCTILPSSSARSEADTNGKSVQGNGGCDAMWDTQICGCGD